MMFESVIDGFKNIYEVIVYVILNIYERDACEITSRM